MREKVRWIAIFSIIACVGTILFAQLAVALKHAFTIPDEPKASSTPPNGDTLHVYQECSAVPNSNFDLIDMILVFVTMFFLTLDLPANILLLIAVKANDQWKFIPWLMVTGVKLIVCIVIICLVVCLKFDATFESSSVYQGTGNEKSLPTNQYIFDKM